MFTFVTSVDFGKELGYIYIIIILLLIYIMLLDTTKVAEVSAETVVGCSAKKKKEKLCNILIVCAAIKL